MDTTFNEISTFTHITYIIFVSIVYQIPSSGAFSIRRFPCDKDRCERGVQYCVMEEHRCYYCKDIVQHCYTNEMPLQCDAYCTGLEAVEREKTLNATFEDYIATLQNTSDTSVEQHYRGYEIAVPFLGLVAELLLVLIIAALLFYKYKLKSTQDESTPKEKDMERAPLIIIPNFANNNSNEDAIHDGLNVDDKKVPALSDVTPQNKDQSRRDSQVSDDSAVESLRSENVKLDEDAKKNEECVPKTDLESGSAKQCGPTRENPGTGGDGANMDARQNTRNMNPTTGENAGTYEVVVNSSGLSALHKQTVRPITQPAVQ